MSVKPRIKLPRATLGRDAAGPVPAEPVLPELTGDLMAYQSSPYLSPSTLARPQQPSFSAFRYKGAVARDQHPSAYHTHAELISLRWL